MTARKPKRRKRKDAGKQRKPERRTKHLMVRLTPERRTQLKAVAAVAGTPASTWAADAVVAGLDAAETAAGARIVERIQNLPDEAPPEGWQERACQRAKEEGII